MDVDDTLVLILERIDSLVSLIRAASTCRRWRRIIADAGFLRRFRSLHGPPVAGDYYNGDPHTVDDDAWFFPSPSTNASDFSLDFIMSVFPTRYSSSWMIIDSRGSLLLLEIKCSHRDSDISMAFRENLVVCEPLTQRYKIIPQPPHYDDAYLVDGDEDETGGRISMSNFRVLCVLFTHEDGVAYTTMFTAGDDSNATWSEKAINHIASRLNSRFTESICKGRALGLCYFYLPKDGTLITHDGSTGKFSLSALPQAIKNCYHARISTRNSCIVDGGDGEPRIIIIMDHTMEVFVRIDEEWKFEKKVLLSKVTCGLPGYQPSFFNKPLTILKRGMGFVVISPTPPRQQMWPFSVDIKTMEVAPAAKGTRNDTMAYQCEFPWPPVLQVCMDR